MSLTATLRYLIGPLELLHEQAGPRLLRLTRLGIFALWLGKLLLDPLWRLAEMPHVLFHPIGPLRLLSQGQIDSLLAPGALTFLLVSNIVISIAAMTNRGFPVTATVASISLTIYSCLIRGFGSAVHTDIVLLLAVYILAAYAWADWLEGHFFHPEKPLDPRRSSYPLVTIVSVHCLTYCLVGLNRTIAGGLGVFTGDTMETWTIEASLAGYFFNTDIGWHVPHWPLVLFMLRAGLPVITLFEITAPLCLAWPHFRWIFIPVMLSFHVLSLVFMNIFFFDEVFLYLLLVDWSRRFPKLSSAPAYRN